MTTTTASIPYSDRALAGSRTDHLSTVGTAVLRYGLVALFLMWGPIKFTPWEAKAIQPLLENSPFMAWLLPVLGLQGTSNLLGVFEISVAALIATRHWFPRVSGYASLAATGMFATTLSFLITTPGVLEPTNPWGGFLLKDMILLGAALFTAGEAFRAAKNRR